MCLSLSRREVRVDSNLVTCDNVMHLVEILFHCLKEMKTAIQCLGIYSMCFVVVSA